MKKEDQIVVEHPVTIKINDQEFATIVCSPEYIEDMAVGFLASEGVIPNYEDIKDISRAGRIGDCPYQNGQNVSFLRKIAEQTLYHLLLRHEPTRICVRK